MDERWEVNEGSMQPRSKANKETTTTSSVITHPQIEIGIAIKDQQGRKEERNQ